MYKDIMAAQSTIMIMTVDALYLYFTMTAELGVIAGSVHGTFTSYIQRASHNYLTLPPDNMCTAMRSSETPRIISSRRFTDTTCHQ